MAFEIFVIGLVILAVFLMLSSVKVVGQGYEFTV